MTEKHSHYKKDVSHLKTLDHTELTLHAQEGLLLRSTGFEYGYVYWRGPKLMQWDGWSRQS